MEVYIEEIEGKVITTVEQSKKLIDLGISPFSASLFLTKDIVTGEEKLVDRLFANIESTPIWTLDDLIHILPDEIDWCQLPPISMILTNYVLGINKKVISYRCENDGKYRIYQEVKKGDTLMDSLIDLIKMFKAEKFNGLKLDGLLTMTNQFHR